MKVLYVGNYLDGTGWSNFCLNQVLSLDAAGVEVVPRPIKLNQANTAVPERIRELEQRSGIGCDIVIQNVLPHLSEYNGKFSKNIIYSLFESSNFRQTSWSQHINLMDELWVPCYHNKKVAEDSFVTKPIHVVPMGVDLNKYNRSAYSTLSFRENLKDSFIFYTIGEFSNRKNLQSLLRAFHAEFFPEENVELVIKVNPQGHPQEFVQKLQGFVNDIKTGLKIYTDITDYKKEIVICQNVNEADVSSIHVSCDCFVTTSVGESVCIPAMDACGFGNPIIYPNYGGIKTWAASYCGFGVPVFEDDLFGHTDASFSDIYTSKEQGGLISTTDLRGYMRKAYKIWKTDKKWWEMIQKSAQKRISEYSYEEVGQIMKEALCGENNSTADEDIWG